MNTLRRLALGISLIAGASALLLCSDLRSRVNSPAAGAHEGQKIVRVALLQQTSQAVHDDGRDGMIAGLAERGWLPGKNMNLKLYCAEGDIATARTIATLMVNSGNDLLLTVSTLPMQSVAFANRSAKIHHVFSLVTDPAGSGVGISASNPLDHPAWLAGYGTIQPVADAFRTAREMNPNLKCVGVAWNTGEVNSRIQMKLARQVCEELGIKLIEAPVDNSAGVGEAAASLVSRGAEALWISGDVTVLVAAETVIAVANKAGVPVFTVIPPQVRKGALFDIGADYKEVGRLAGLLAGDILNGRDPATVAIENKMPEILTLNLQAAAKLKGGWTIPESLRNRARILINEDGSEKAAGPAGTPSPSPSAAVPLRKKWRISVILFNETPTTEEAVAGMTDAWKESRLKDGTDYSIKISSAQGDMATLSGIVDAAVTRGTDLFVPVSTPAMQVTMAKIRKMPIVFTVVANPVAAGAGTSYTDHLPNITGVTVAGPCLEMLDMLKTYYPSFRHIGTLFCPAEINSTDLRDALAAACRERGYTLDAVAANSPTELPEAAMSLAARPIDAIVQISDNLAGAGFAAITRAAQKAHKPLFSMNSTAIAMGAPVVLGRDYHSAGSAVVPLIEKIIAGESPAGIPFIPAPKLVLAVSKANARAVGMTIPVDLLKHADKVNE